MVQVNVRIDPALYAQVKAKAEKQGLTITAATDAAYRDYVKGSK
jgi:predicted HicB family RNase H-like nuclease